MQEKLRLQLQVQRSAGTSRRRPSIDFGDREVEDNQATAGLIEDPLLDGLEAVPFDEDAPTTTWNGRDDAKLGPDEDTPIDASGEDLPPAPVDLSVERGDAGYSGLVYCLAQPRRPLLAHPQRPGLDPVHMAAFFAAFAPLSQAGVSGKSPGASDSVSPMAVSAMPGPWKHPSTGRWLAPGVMVTTITAVCTVLAGFVFFNLSPTPVGVAVGDINSLQPSVGIDPTALLPEPPTDLSPLLADSHSVGAPAASKSLSPQTKAVSLRTEPAKTQAKEPSAGPPPRTAFGPEQLPPLVPPEVEIHPFNRGSALSALNAAASSASACRDPNTANTPVGVHVTFAPSGVVTVATVDGFYAGTAVGGCVARAFRSARISPFSGQAVTVHKTFQLP